LIRSGMPTVAEQLRQAREERGWTVHQLADMTKIRTDHIRALEEGDYNVFAAPVYIQGFVRTCATLLKLDVPAVMSALEAELGQTKKFREHPRLTGESRGVVDYVMLQFSKINWRVGLPVAILGILIVGGIVTYRTIKLRQSEDPLKDLGPGVYQPKRSDVIMAPPSPPPATNAGRANR
jgi:cytoskeletal protein RodZ